jgi:hypothetical protein
VARGSLYRSPLAIMAQTIRTILLASAIAATLVGRRDQPVELQDLLLDPAQLSLECRETRTSDLRNSLVVRIGDDSEQFLDTPAPTGATIPNSARRARIALITEVCWRMNRWRARWSTRLLCCSGVLVGTNRSHRIFQLIDQCLLRAGFTGTSRV